MRTILILLMSLIGFTAPVFSAEDLYAFANPKQAMQFEQLTKQLRCLVCQNQNLAESNAPLANDLRKQIYEKISHGQTDMEILDYLVTRYGNFILYKPPLDKVTGLLWFAPLSVLLAGMAYLIYYLRKNRTTNHA